jgi:hypothetical protein
MNAGILRITKKLLCELLKLPESTTIVGISDQMFFQTGDIAVTITDPGIKPVLEGGAIPVVKPAHRKILATPERVEFEGWDQR